MKWESLLLTAIAAGSAMAIAPGHEHAHRRRHLARNAKLQAREADVDDNVVFDTKTVVKVDVVTVYTTVTNNADPATTVVAAETLAVIDSPSTLSTSISTSSSSSTSLDVLDVPTTTTTTTTTATTTTTTTTTTTAITTTSSSSNWTSTPSSNDYSTAGFGARTTSSGSGIEYSGNVGSPWGSNIIEVTSSTASQYKYVVQITGSNTVDWFVSFWNKIGPDGKMDGWYGHSALNFTLAAGETRYVAFDENSQGGWGAAEGDSLPTDEYGGYACTWGEFDFGDTDNEAWSGWDVSAIQAQNAGLTVQGMRICEYTGEDCSYITAGAAEVVNAYTAAEAAVDGIGGAVGAGAVRLVVELDYSG